MLATLLTTMIMIMAWSSMSTNNPMNLSLIIMMMAMLTSMLYSLMLSAWYSMILFLIYIGSMMVMFSYFMSFSSNDPMLLKTKMHFIILPVILMKSMKMNTMMPSYKSPQMFHLYTNSNMTILILVTIILLSMMIIVIKSIKTNNAPLRGFNKNTNY